MAENKKSRLHMTKAEVEADIRMEEEKKAFLKQEGAKFEEGKVEAKKKSK
jgi:hypothetical protein